jgi:hypothetical protein
MALAVSALSADRVGQKPFGGPATAESHDRADSLTGFDVLSYDLTLSINQASHQINGNVLATVLAEQNLTSIPYNLIGLTVSSVLVNGEAAPYTHSNGIINISLNIPAGQTFTTQVFYSGIPQLSPAPYNIGMIFSGNTVFTISDPDAARYWWPCYDHPWDKAIVHLRITLRSDWKVAANGIRESIVDNGDGTSTTFWTGSHPMATYLACITCGPYEEINQIAGTVPIQNFVMPNQYNNALSDLANLPDMVNYFSQAFGPYPFEKYGNAVVSMSTYGAMEHQTMTTLGSYIINGNGTYETTIAHELAHQWYGNAVSFLTFKDVWLSEGFATYSEHLWTDHTDGWQAACNYVAANFHQYYINWEAGAGPQVIYDPAFNDYFAPPSYEKAASVLHMLRLKMGNANFFQLLQNWFSSNNSGNVITSEFQAMAESISGQDLDQFFNQWIYSAGIPALEYTVWSNDEWYTPLKIKARTISNTSTPFHIEVPFRFENGAETDSLLVLADPDWYTNYYQNEYGPDAVLTANYHNWTLIRNAVELKPVLAECMPSNSSVLLAWDRFMNNSGLDYLIMRRQMGTTEWQQLNSEPVSGYSYTDLTAQNGVTYQYAIAAVDTGDWISVLSNVLEATPVTFAFTQNLLVVDETRDGTGANINPNDTMVDDFYAAALSPIVHEDWDVASQGLPGLDILGMYRVVFWHADDFSQNLLADHLNTLGGYLLGGGKVLLSGWKTASILSDTFLQRFGGDPGLTYDNSPCLISAQSTNYPELAVDPLKTLPAWNNMLPYIYTFSNADDQIYQANMNANAQGDGSCIALRHADQSSGAEFVFFGFPLYFMQPAGVRGFLQQIIPELLTPVANQDPSLPPAVASLEAYPNPFQSTTEFKLNLPSRETALLKIFNLKGQLVRTIAVDAKSAGTTQVLFDGRDGRGNRLPSGVYIVRMDHAGQTLVKRISLVK